MPWWGFEQQTYSEHHTNVVMSWVFLSLFLSLSLSLALFLSYISLFLSFFIYFSLSLSPWYGVKTNASFTSQQEKTYFLFAFTKIEIYQQTFYAFQKKSFRSFLLISKQSDKTNIFLDDKHKMLKWQNLQRRQYLDFVSKMTSTNFKCFDG